MRSDGLSTSREQLIVSRNGGKHVFHPLISVVVMADGSECKMYSNRAFSKLASSSRQCSKHNRFHGTQRCCLHLMSSWSFTVSCSTHAYSSRIAFDMENCPCGMLAFPGR